MSFADHDAKQAPPTLMHRGFTAPQGSSTAAWPRRTSAPRPARGWRSADRHFPIHRQRHYAGGVLRFAVRHAVRGGAMEFGLATSRAAHNSALCISFIRKCAEADLRAVELVSQRLACNAARRRMDYNTWHPSRGTQPTGG